MKPFIQTPDHYTWGNQCDGWHLLKTEGLSVIRERMPPGTFESLHFHHFAQQLFYILSGTATFEIEDEIIIANMNESVHIPKGVKHFIANKTESELIFLVISEPKAHGDRENL